jgi:hypothetical protein
MKISWRKPRYVFGNLASTAYTHGTSQPNSTAYEGHMVVTYWMNCHDVLHFSSSIWSSCR